MGFDPHSGHSKVWLCVRGWGEGGGEGSRINPTLGKFVLRSAKVSRQYGESNLAHFDPEAAHQPIEITRQDKTRREGRVGVGVATDVY
jgi:hypothetical protein